MAAQFSLGLTTGIHTQSLGQVSALVADCAGAPLPLETGGGA